jgi:ketosteroid isomerase-like protein
MKTKVVVIALLLALVFFSCKEKEKMQEKVPMDLVNDEFPEAKAEVMAFMEELKQSIIDGDVEKLIAYHAYGPKFTEFTDGQKRTGSAENEKMERSIFENVTVVEKFDFKDLKIAVYDQVANITFHSDFEMMFGEDKVVVNDQITLLVVKTPEGWKFVHEHHSPLKAAEEVD